jgi:hypothetical protein
VVKADGHPSPEHLSLGERSKAPNSPSDSEAVTAVLRAQLCGPNRTPRVSTGIKRRFVADPAIEPESEEPPGPGGVACLQGFPITVGLGHAAQVVHLRESHPGDFGERAQRATFNAKLSAFYQNFLSNRRVIYHSELPFKKSC